MSGNLWATTLSAGIRSLSWLTALRRAVADGDEQALAIEYRANNHALRARRALAALGGEASEAELLAWVEKNCRLRSEWQTNLLLALHYHANGEGDGSFVRMPGEPDRWSLAPGFGGPSAQVTVPATANPANGTLVTPGLVSKLIAHGGISADGTLNGMDRYLLALGAFELGQFAAALELLDGALAGGLSDDFRERATRLRDVCALKAGAG